jgi:hypothetical protein
LAGDADQFFRPLGTNYFQKPGDAGLADTGPAGNYFLADTANLGYL